VWPAEARHIERVARCAFPFYYIPLGWEREELEDSCSATKPPFGAYSIEEAGEQVEEEDRKH
jgi:hypothetical protein